MKCGEKETFSEMLHIAREYIEEQKSIRESEEEFLLRTYKMLIKNTQNVWFSCLQAFTSDVNIKHTERESIITWYIFPSSFEYLSR